MLAYVINLDSRPDRMEEFKQNKFPFEVHRFSGIVANTGEDGCTNSHLSLLQQNQYKTPFAIFEDDCIMLEPWETVIKAMKQLPANWDALWLGATVRTSLNQYSENLYRLDKGWATHAIIYNSRMMIQYILKNHNTPSGKNLDIFYHRILQKRFNCYITYPLVASQRSGYSNISNQEIDYNAYIMESYKRFVK